MRIVTGGRVGCVQIKRVGSVRITFKVCLRACVLPALQRIPPFFPGKKEREKKERVGAMMVVAKLRGFGTLRKENEEKRLKEKVRSLVHIADVSQIKADLGIAQRLPPSPFTSSLAGESAVNVYGLAHCTLPALFVVSV
jgi:hypothetical protein